MARRTSLPALAAALAAALLLAGCLGKEPPPDPHALAVGALLPFTGGNAASGSNLERALMLAVENVNAGGGVGGRDLRLVARDTRTDPAWGLEKAQELLDGEKVVALMGPESEELAQALGPLMAQRRIVQISGGLVSPAFTSVEDGDFCFRTNPSATELSAALADRMSRDGVRTAVIIHESDVYGVQFANALGLAAGARGINTGLPMAIEPGLSSHGPLIQMALEHKPDAVVMVSYPEQAAGIALEWSAVGGTLRWYLPPSLRHQVFADNLPPSLVEGMVGVAAAVRDEAAFAAAFSSRWYGEEPTNGAAYYYDALAVWALAAEATWHEQGELTPEVLRQQLRAVTRSPGEKVAWNDLGRALSLVREGKDVDYVGASGEVDLDAHGDAAATATRFWTIRNGRVQDE